MGAFTNRTMLLLAWSAVASSPAQAAGADFRLQPIGNGVWAAIVNDDGLGGANAGFIIGENGVLVVDTFSDPKPAKALLAEIRKLTKLPVRFVVNTHYHLDHVNGNDVFAAAGATIIAQRNVPGWMRTENLKMIEPPVTPEKRARVGSLTLPDIVYDGEIDLYLGSRKIEIRSYPGHTGGDSVVSVPDAHVVFCGDLLWKRHVPNLIDARTEDWIRTLDFMVANYKGSAWVPGHGGLARDQGVRAFAGYLADLRAEVRREQQQGKSGESLVQALLPSRRSRYGKWRFFALYACANMLETEQELSEKKTVPIAVDPACTSVHTVKRE